MLYGQMTTSNHLLDDEFDILMESFNTTEMLVEEQETHKVVLLSTAQGLSPGSEPWLTPGKDAMSNGIPASGQPFPMIVHRN